VSGYAEGLLVILAINVIAAYAAFLPLAAGQLNLGIAGFMAIGAYASAFLAEEIGWAPAVTIVCAAAATGAAGLLIGYPVLRARGIYLVLATLAFGEVVRSSILSLDVVGGAAGYPVKGHIGWLPVTVVATVAFALGAMLAGIAGALYGHHFSYIEAQHYNVVNSVYVAMYVLLGGVQTVLGPLLGAAFFTLIPEAFRIGDTWRFVIFAVALILTMVWRPEGLVDRDLIDRLRPRKS
jgi:branched-chain amino acid transport system permease protein